MKSKKKGTSIKSILKQVFQMNRKYKKKGCISVVKIPPGKYTDNIILKSGVFLDGRMD